MRNKTLPYAKASIATRIARGIKMPKAVYNSPSVRMGICYLFGLRSDFSHGCSAFDINDI